MKFCVIIAVSTLIIVSAQPLVAYADTSPAARKTVVVPAEGSQILPQNPTLEDYLLYAEANNPFIQTAYYRWQAALQRIKQAVAPPNPKFSYGYFFREVETRVGPQRQKFGLSQGIPFPGQLKQKGRLAAAEAAVAEQQYFAAKFMVLGKLKAAYYDFYYLSKSISITEENRQLLESFVKITEVKLKVGKAPQAILLKAQVELETLDDRLKSLREARRPLVSRLKSLLNLANEQTLPWPKPEKQPLSINESELQNALAKTAPNILIIRSEIKKAREALRLADYEGKPKFMVGVDVIETRRSFANVDENGKDPIMGMLQIEIPIWRGSIRAKKAEARLRLEATRSSKQNIQNDLRSEFFAAIFNLNDARRKLELYEKAIIPKAVQALKSSETAYATGKIDFLSLLDSQRIVLVFRLNYEQAYRDYWKAAAKIEEITGTPLVGSDNGKQ